MQRNKKRGNAQSLSHALPRIPPSGTLSATESLVRIESLADALPVLISYVDRNFRYQFNNASYRQWFRISKRALLGRHVREVLGQKAWSALKHEMASALAGEHRSFELSVPYKTRGRRDVQVDYVPHRNPSGQVLGFYALIRDISDRKQLEHKLKESEAFNRAVLNSLTAHVAVLDEHGMILAVNEAWNAFARANGDPDLRATGVGINYLDVCRRDPTASPVRLGLARVLRKNSQSATLEYEYPCSLNHVERWFLMLASPLGASSGGAVVSHIDITNRKLAETRLLRQNQILEQVHDAIVVTDLHGTITSWSHSAEQMFGYPPAEIVGRGISRLFFPQKGLCEKSLLRQLRSHIQVVRYRRKDGSEIYTDCRLAFLRDAEGSPNGVIFCLTDVTSRRKAEEALRASEANLARAQQIAGIGSYEQDLTSPGHCFWSEQTLRLLGRTSPKLSANDFLTKVIHPADRDRVREMRQNAGSTGKPYRLEYRILRPDGETRWLHCACQPFSNEKGVVVKISGTLHDITERKKLENRIAQVVEEEQRRIARDLHDGLGQLLTGTMHLVSGLAERLSGADPSIQNEAARILQLLDMAISDTRQLARGLYPVRMDLGGLSVALERLAQGARDLYHINCTVKLSRLPAIKNQSAAIHIYRIVQESIQNAVRHGKCKSVHVFLRLSGSTACLSVKDDGLGFVPSAFSARGMGVQIMRSRAAILGGTLSIASRRNAGTRISCQFPRSVLIETVEANEYENSHGT